jgi:hypothetical protein
MLDNSLFAKHLKKLTACNDNYSASGLFSLKIFVKESPCSFEQGDFI